MSYVSYFPTILYLDIFTLCRFPELDLLILEVGEAELEGCLSGNGLGGLNFILTGIMSSKTTQLWLPPANIL